MKVLRMRCGPVAFQVTGSVLAIFCALSIAIALGGCAASAFEWKIQALNGANSDVLRSEFRLGFAAQHRTPPSFRHLMFRATFRFPAPEFPRLYIRNELLCGRYWCAEGCHSGAPRLA